MPDLKKRAQMKSFYEINGMKKELSVISFFVLFFIMVMVYPIYADNTEEQLWQKGNALCLQAKWKEAVKTFQTLLESYPDTRHVEARFWIGYSNIEMGQYGQGIKELKEFAKKYPQNNYTPQALFKVGEVYETRLKQYDRALAAYNEVVNRYPQNLYSVPAAQNQAVIYERRKKDYVSAEQALNKSKQMAKAQSMTPGNIYITRANQRISFIKDNSDYKYQPLSLFTDGINLEEENKLTDAAQKYKVLLQKYPASNIADNALYRRIDCLFKLRWYKEAVVEAEKFIVDYPKSPYLPGVRSMLEQAKKRGSLVFPLYFVCILSVC